jgi:hypothetical protein
MDTIKQKERYMASSKMESNTNEFTKHPNSSPMPVEVICSSVVVDLEKYDKVVMRVYKHEGEQVMSATRTIVPRNSFDSLCATSLKTFFKDDSLTPDIKRSLYPRIWIRTSDLTELAISLILTTEELKLLQEDVNWSTETQEMKATVMRGGDISWGEMLAMRMYDFDLGEISSSMDASLAAYDNDTQVIITVYLIRNLHQRDVIFATHLMTDRQPPKPPKPQKMAVKLGDIRKLQPPSLSEYVFSLLFKEQFKSNIHVKKMFLQAIFLTQQKSKHSNGKNNKVNFALYMQHDKRDLLKPMKLRQMNMNIIGRSIAFSAAGSVGLVGGVALLAGSAHVIISGWNAISDWIHQNKTKHGSRRGEPAGLHGMGQDDDGSWIAGGYNQSDEFQEIYL